MPKRNQGLMFFEKHRKRLYKTKSFNEINIIQSDATFDLRIRSAVLPACRQAGISTCR